MTTQFSNRNFVVLLLGDAVTVLIVTLIGFASHELSPFNPRVWATYVPMLAAWLLVAPWLGLFQPEVIRRPIDTWRAGLAAALAAPIATILRGLWLNTLVAPIFALVFGAVAALGMIIWRLGWVLIFRRKISWTN